MNKIQLQSRSNINTVRQALIDYNNKKKLQTGGSIPSMPGLSDMAQSLVPDSAQLDLAQSHQNDYMKIMGTMGSIPLFGASASPMNLIPILSYNNPNDPNNYKKEQISEGITRFENIQSERKGAAVGGMFDSASLGLNMVLPGLGTAVNKIGIGKMLGKLFGKQGNTFDYNIRDQNIDTGNSYQQGGEINVPNVPYNIQETMKNIHTDPSYEAETGEIVIKNYPKEHIRMFGPGNLTNESAYAAEITGRTHEEGGEDMSGGSYMLSDKKTLDFTTPNKNNPSVATIAKPYVKMLSASEERKNDRYAQEMVPFALSGLNKIQEIYDENKKRAELLEMLQSGEITMEDLFAMQNPSLETPQMPATQLSPGSDPMVSSAPQMQQGQNMEVMEEPELMGNNPMAQQFKYGGKMRRNVQSSMRKLNKNC